MLFSDFVKEIPQLWSKYFADIYKHQQKGNLNSQGGFPLYPNIVLLTNADGFFTAELIGANKGFTSLKPIIHKKTQIYVYLSQSHNSSDSPLFYLDDERCRMTSLILAYRNDANYVRERFPYVSLISETTLMHKNEDGNGSILAFGPNFSSCSIENCVIINRYNNIVRCKNILQLLIIRSTISKKKIVEFFNDITASNKVSGVHTVSSTEEESLIVAGHLQSMYLSSWIRETAIGEFISKHINIIHKAFNTSKFLYEPHLKWIEHDGSVNDDAINPDLIIRRPDGMYDIYDLKTALLDRKSIVRGQRNRRRFIDHIEEGAAQLANYREYFKYSKNRELAKLKYGIDIQDPRLVLIAGSWENANPKEIEEACRRYHDINIIDFDTLTHLFIGTKQASS